MVVAWLVCVMSLVIDQSVFWIVSAKTMWNELQERLSQEKIFRMSDVQELLNFR